MQIKAVKSAGDEWALEVLGCPYYGPKGGKDAHGEYFSPRTNFHSEAITLPPVAYYHGFTPDGRPQGSPEFIGRTVKRWVDDRGVWYRVILDKASAWAQRVWDAAKAGLAVASSGSMPHLVRTSADGHIDHWLVSELSLWDGAPGREQANGYAVALPAVKALYQAAGLHLPSVGTRKADEITIVLDDRFPTMEDRRSGVERRHTDRRSATVGNDEQTDEIKAAVADAYEAGRKSMQAEPPTSAAIKSAVNAEIARIEQERAAKLREEQAREAEIERRVNAVKAELEEQIVASRRLPYGTIGGQAPHVAKFAALRPYDNLDAADMAFVAGLLDAAKQDGNSRYGISEAALKALAVKLAEDTTRVGAVGQAAMKALGIKANEVMTSTMVGFGDEWIGQAYSTALWEAIRLETFVLDMLKPVEIPQGMESITLPTEGADMTFYSVGQATDTDASGWPASTIPSSKTATGQRVLRASKLAGRLVWEGDLDEDSVIPFAQQIRTQTTTAAAEYLEHVVVDGDTATAAAANINNGGAADVPGAKVAYTAFDGLRKLALVTNAANSRAGAVLADSDFLETVKLMGQGGRNAVDKKKTTFLIDPMTNYKMLTLGAVKTRDVNSAATIENGDLTMIYGYKVKISGQQARLGGGLTNASGKVDQVAPANNTKGSILALRADQWAAGYKRKLKLETTRIARADAYEITAIMRFGLLNRDLEASALTFNLTV